MQHSLVTLYAWQDGNPGTNYTCEFARVARETCEHFGNEKVTIARRTFVTIIYSDSNGQSTRVTYDVHPHDIWGAIVAKRVNAPLNSLVMAWDIDMKRLTGQSLLTFCTVPPALRNLALAGEEERQPPTPAQPAKPPASNRPQATVAAPLIKRGSLDVQIEVELNSPRAGVAKPSIDLVLTNITDELLEYRVEELTIEISGVRGSGAAINRGGFLGPKRTTKYLTDPIGEIALSGGVFLGNLDYRIAYWPSDNPQNLHHTMKSVSLEMYYETMRGAFKTKSEHED